MKKISLLMLLAFSVLTFGAFAQTRPATASANHSTVMHKAAAKKHAKKHPKKHVKKHPKKSKRHPAKRKH